MGLGQLIAIVGTISTLVFVLTVVLPYMNSSEDLAKGKISQEEFSQKTAGVVDKSVHESFWFLSPLEWASQNPGPLGTLVVFCVVGVFAFGKYFS